MSLNKFQSQQYFLTLGTLLDFFRVCLAYTLKMMSRTVAIKQQRREEEEKQSRGVSAVPTTATVHETASERRDAQQNKP